MYIVLEKKLIIYIYIYIYVYILSGTTTVLRCFGTVLGDVLVISWLCLDYVLTMCSLAICWYLDLTICKAVEPIKHIRHRLSTF